MKPPLPLVFIALKDPQIPSQLPTLPHQMQTSKLQSQSNGEPAASGGLWSHFPMNLSHCGQRFYRHMSCSASRPRPQPGAQTGSGWQCSRTRSQRTDQGSLGAVC